MTRPETKHEEKRHLSMAFGKLQIQYTIENANHETPDFIVIINGKRVGVEITREYKELVQGRRAKEFDASIGNVIRASLEHYLHKGGMPIILRVVLDGTRIYYRKNAFIDDMAKYLLAHQPDVNHSDVLFESIYDTTHNTELSPVTEIGIIRSKTNESCVLPMSIFKSSEATPIDIDAAVERKSRDLEKYPNDLAEKWLIIMLPFLAMAGDLLLPNNKYILNTQGFDKVIIYDEHRDKAIVI